MLLVLGDKRYPWVDLNAATLEDLDRIEAESGLTVDRIEDLWSGSEPLHRSKDARQAMRVRVWLCRRAAGEDVPIAEATAGVAVADMLLVADDGDPLPDEGPADPTVPGPGSSTD